MKKIKNNLVGQKFGRLTVIEYSHTNRYYYWKCICECGNEHIASSGNLKFGNTKSCGCYGKQMLLESNLKHGKYPKNLYEKWHGIKSRCYNNKDSNFYLYGGRGIKVCDEWKNSYIAFRDWALTNGYQEGLTIDRIDNNGNYCPENCRWATIKEQANNRRDNKLITYNSKTQTVSQWADELGLNYCVLNGRLRKGWSIERALESKLYAEDKSSIMITYNGETKNISQWIKKLNVNAGLLRTRIKRGWSIEDALTIKKYGKYGNKSK